MNECLCFSLLPPPTLAQTQDMEIGVEFGGQSVDSAFAHDPVLTNPLEAFVQLPPFFSQAA